MAPGTTVWACPPSVPIRQRRPLDQFEDQRPDALGLLQPVDAPDVGMVQRRQHLGFALKPSQPVGVGREGLGQIG